MDSIRISRTCTEEIKNYAPLVSIGASYTHIKSLKGTISAKTKRVVMYHAMLESLEGLEDAEYLDHAYLGFNRIQNFRSEDQKIKVGILDLAGNPITTLRNVPVCEELIVSSTKITNLLGVSEGTKIIRCGHSSFLTSLEGCPKSIKLIECSCSPNLIYSTIDPSLFPDLEEIIGDFGWWRRGEKWIFRS
jgi:hypothetical protein